MTASSAINARLVGDAGLRPLLERGDKRVLRQHGEFSEDLTIIMNALWCLQLAWALLVSREVKSGSVVKSNEICGIGTPDPRPPASLLPDLLA